MFVCFCVYTCDSSCQLCWPLVAYSQGKSPAFPDSTEGEAEGGDESSVTLCFCWQGLLRINKVNGNDRTPRKKHPLQADINLSRAQFLAQNYIHYKSNPTVITIVQQMQWKKCTVLLMVKYLWFIKSCIYHPNVQLLASLFLKLDPINSRQQRKFSGCPSLT